MLQVGRANKIMKTREKVKEVLIDNYRARNSDKLLLIDYMKRYHNIDIPLEILDPTVPSFESIRRARQKLQENGDYPATFTTKVDREAEEIAYRYTHGR